MLGHNKKEERKFDINTYAGISGFLTGQSLDSLNEATIYNPFLDSVGSILKLGGITLGFAGFLFGRHYSRKREDLLDFEIYLMDTFKIDQKELEGVPMHELLYGNYVELHIKKESEEE